MSISQYNISSRDCHCWFAEALDVHSYSKHSRNEVLLVGWSNKDVVVLKHIDFVEKVQANGSLPVDNLHINGTQMKGKNGNCYNLGSDQKKN